MSQKGKGRFKLIVTPVTEHFSSVGKEDWEPVEISYCVLASQSQQAANAD